MPKPNADAVYKAATARYLTFTPSERRLLRALRNSRKLCMEAAARELCMARNTVKYHVDKIKDKTGLDPQTFDGLAGCLEIMEEENRDV